jgi:hypothetical protein
MNLISYGKEIKYIALNWPKSHLKGSFISTVGIVYEIIYIGATLKQVHG